MKMTKQKKPPGQNSLYPGGSYTIQEQIWQLHTSISGYGGKRQIVNEHLAVHGTPRLPLLLLLGFMKLIVDAVNQRLVGGIDNII